MQSTARAEIFLSVKNGGCLRFNFLLTAVMKVDGQFLYMLNTNNSMEKNLTKFKIASRHVFCDQGKSLYEKTEVTNLAGRSL